MFTVLFTSNSVFPAIVPTFAKTFDNSFMVTTFGILFLRYDYISIFIPIFFVVALYISITTYTTPKGTIFPSMHNEKN